MRRATLNDVSRKSGLSTFTVSRVLNEQSGVSAESRKRVNEAARELGYVPNRAARELKGSRSRSIAVITAGTSNAYYLDMMNGITAALRDTGYTASILDAAAGGDYSPELEFKTISGILEARMSGVISALTLTPETIARLEEWETPLLFVDSSPPPQHAHLPSVTTDNMKASRMVGRHLEQHGFGRWLFVAYPAIWSSRHDREAGLREAAHAAGADITVLETANDAEAAADALRRHLSGPGDLPDVLIAGNTPLLLGALQALRAEGIRVPEDMALVCFDEFAWAPYIDPPITVLNEQASKIGRLAGEMIGGLIRKRQAGSDAPSNPGEGQIKVPVDLIVRRSCGCMP